MATGPRGPQPSYRPRFTPEQLAEARKVANRQNAPHVKVQRARMVLILAEQPEIRTAALSRLVGVHEQTARKWRKRWSREGFSLNDAKGRGRKRSFSPCQIAEVKAIACQLPKERQLPLSRFSLSEIQETILTSSGLITQISTGTIWRILNEDAIRPWYHQSWLFVKDPDFVEKAGPVLDLYQGFWHGEALGANDYVICADEKTSIQARLRVHESLPPCPGRIMRIEHEYERGGALSYLAALDVQSGHVIGRTDQKNGIVPFTRLVDQVMTKEPYASADRIFFIVDNGSSHHPNTFPQRLQEAYPNAIAVHLPIHASWLNQIEIYFSIVQRKALNPNDLADQNAVAARLSGFQERYNRTARPFDWRFTKQDMEERMQHIDMAA